jgi:tetratricopeptide (TPR) repeat protein
MPLLELAVKEDPHCPRNAFYHARELTFYHRWEEAIVALNRYLNLPQANWVNERCYAYRLLGKSHEHLKQHYDALKYYRLACMEAPNTREPWCDLSVYCYMTQVWDECYYSATQALKVVNKEDVYTSDPTVWTEKPYDMASISAYHLGLAEKAYEHIQKALEFAPNDERLLKNKTFIEAIYDGNRSKIEQPRSGLRPTLRTDQCTLETA